ncbi:MAG TPA: twin-arginine translocase TatA/TatE family subunit [Solirubrobacteraceae bacterium]|jgi:sec-independent protein translocase protein TatA|nr:twin-arginine translocase TatA/TatE family subunit [Solirubrobacteraceae bacterium]
MPFVGSIGPLELLVVLGIILLIFGPKRLPAAGRALGQGIREFKDSITSRRGRGGDDEEPAELPAGPSRVSTPEGPPRPATPEGASTASGTPEGASTAPGSPEGERVVRK